MSAVGEREATGAVVVDGPRLSAATARALREAWGALWTSRLVVWAAGVLGILWFGRLPVNGKFDPAGLTAPFSPFGDLLAAPTARWDSVLYLLIARDGYGPATDPAVASFNQAKPAFYPLYPLLIHAGNWALGSPLLVAVLISLASFFGALALLYRLTEIELGPSTARATLLILAFFPSAFYLSAVYTESLFLLLTIASVLAARQGRWAWAGIAGGLAALTRNSGILLVVPLVLLFLYGPRADREQPAQAGGPRWRPRHPLAPQILWLGLVPLGLALFLGYSAIKFDDALTPFHLQHTIWHHHFVALGGIWSGISSAWHELGDVVHSRGATYAPGSGGIAIDFPGLSVVLLGFVGVALAGFVGVLRRLPFAYGAYVGVTLATTLSFPTNIQPLEAFPRYMLVIFPIYMWLAQWCEERGRLGRALGISAVLLGLMTAQFARWGFTG